MTVHQGTRDILQNIATTYGLRHLAEVIRDDGSIVWGKDVTLCLTNILKAVEAKGDTKTLLREAKNLYNTPIFAVNAPKGEFLIKADPDPARAVAEMKRYDFCFRLSPYHVINTFLTLLVAQVTGHDPAALVKKGEEHLEAFVAHSLKENPSWNRATLTSPHPLLIIPIGAAGCGKSTFFRELGNVVNASCDNIRYLLFKDLGPCFAPWESTLAWWVVNRLTDLYLAKGYSVFYNGVNTDPEYRSPITMENPDPLFAGMPYTFKLVYFEPPVSLFEAELAQLKGINLWATPLEKVDRTGLGPNVQAVLDLIARNFQRTMERTGAIREGKASQDPFDILYAVPPAIVKLFVEQSFARPIGPRVVTVPRREIPDPAARAAFYREYAAKALAPAPAAG
ncbi:MAG: ATP-binding protein [Candidatus Riflebacteria bacterium]|nr:ATP-binding protein [Candidatus Riflebacteria bacterium]